MNRMVGFLVVTMFTLALSADSKLDLRMPNVKPQNPDTYLCFSTKVTDPSLYITAFEPHAKMQTAHHMLLYGCKSPGRKTPVWNCGEMAMQSDEFESGPTCANGGNIIYGWAMDAPSLKLPKDVAFQVGGDNDVDYLVLQVHYKDVTDFIPPNNKEDSSGITLTTTTTPLPKTAGIYLIGSSGTIPKNSVEYMESVCKFDEDVTIHPFTFRTHTHTLGRVVSGYRIRDGEWTEIGRRDPRDPQMFYNVTTPGIDVKAGDLLAARCTFENLQNHEVRIGATSSDEMCNFYIMYYVDGNKLADRKYCFLPGPPDFYWEDFEGGNMNMDAMPKTVSTTPRGKHWIKSTDQEEFELDERDAEYLQYLLQMEDRRLRDDDEYY